MGCCEYKITENNAWMPHSIPTRIITHTFVSFTNQRNPYARLFECELWHNGSWCVGSLCIAYAGARSRGWELKTSCGSSNETAEGRARSGKSYTYNTRTHAHARREFHRVIVILDDRVVAGRQWYNTEVIRKRRILRYVYVSVCVRIKRRKPFFFCVHTWNYNKYSHKYMAAIFV